MVGNRRFGLASFLITWCLWVASGTAFAQTEEVTGRRAALVIGNSGYQTLPQLPNAVNDAEQIAGVLRDANFEVTLGSNLDKAGMERSVRAFLQTLNDGDVALFYYSGHAVQVAGENFIIPVDASLSSSYDLELQSYSVTSLLDYMRESSGLQILVLDACRDNPFRNEQYFLGDKKIDVTGKQGLASLAPRLGSLIVYSTAPDQVAYDGAEDISPFAEAFVSHALSPNREIREVLTTIRTEVIDKTGGRQIPWDVSSLTSQFYLVSAQNTLVLSESATEVRVSPATTEVKLSIQPPLDSGGMVLTASFDKLPQKGMLLLDGKSIAAATPFDAARIGEVTYVTDPGPKSLEFIPYTIASNTGQQAKGAVAIVFDPALEDSEADAAPAVVASVDQSKAETLTPVRLALTSDVGTGFRPIAAVVRGTTPAAGWFKIDRRDAQTQVAIDQTMLVVGDVLPAADLPRLKVRPAIHAPAAQTEVVLTPVSSSLDAKPVIIAVQAETNACDELAAEPLDLQAVTEGVFPNDIRIREALTACRQAITDFPDVPRFRFQYARVLYANGDFEAAVGMAREAVRAGHVRAGQFLGRLHQLGSGVELDPAKAIPLFEAAAKRGDPYGQYALGRALLDGNGAKADVQRGMDLLHKAAESGHTYALNQLGSEYLSGKRAKKDVERAYVMFKASAERSDVWGQVNLGLMYRDGIFVERDPKRAYELFEQANRNLHPYAATRMGMLDRDRGTADQARVLALFRESAARGDGWGAYYAAEMISKDSALSANSSEAVRLYALAAARNAGAASERSRERLGALPRQTTALEIQNLLMSLGVSGIEADGKIGPRVRDAAATILGAPPPQEPVDLLISLARHEWVKSTPRLDML